MISPTGEGFIMGSRSPASKGATEVPAGSDRVYTVADLFSGAGGFTQGLVQSGRFRSVFANDFNRWACQTYNANFGPHCIEGDINRILRRQLLIPKIDIVVGGPPCQGFSLLNKKREGDPRKDLWRAYMRFVERTEPIAFVMENVPELLKSLEFEEICRRTRKLGYRWAVGILNAADFGVPQRRKRFIMIANRVGIPELPAATHADPNGGAPLIDGRLPAWRTVRQAIGDLPPKPIGTEIRPEQGPPLDLHFGRKPTEKSMLRYRCVPEGGNRVDLQKRRRDLTPNCWIKKQGGTDLFGRLWWDRPSFTIRTEFFKPEKGRYLHPSEHRPITHREAARLMSFPDSFVFKGTKIEVAKQIGNAVPCNLAQRIGEALAKVLDQALTGSRSERATALA
jgi:DNA (cytosine-5)-methyltransferase 1